MGANGERRMANREWIEEPFAIRYSPFAKLKAAG
jgi:hypothetical protein